MEKSLIEKMYFSLQKNEELTTFFKSDIINTMGLTSDPEIIIHLGMQITTDQINVIYKHIFSYAQDLNVWDMSVQYSFLQINIK